MSTDIPTLNFCVRSGNTGTTENEDGLVLNITGASGFVFHFKTSSFTGGPLIKTSPTDITVVGDVVTIPLTLSDNLALLGAGGPVAYEVERRATGGGQRSLVTGNITAITGLTDD